jgi:hypothetical protein
LHAEWNGNWNWNWNWNWNDDYGGERRRIVDSDLAHRRFVGWQW